MGTTTMGVKLDDATRERIKSAATRIDRTPHWLIKQAIFSYLEQLENSNTLPELPALLSGAANESDEAPTPAEEPHQPFLDFAEQILPQSVSRAAITAAYRRPETEAVSMLLEQARLPQPVAEQAHKLAYQLADKLRNQKNASGRAGMVQGLLQEFSLSSQEGVALMCLAEALLRIPDKATRDALIRDKISNGNWQSHIGRSPSLFVNAATWGLLFTGKLVSTHNEPSLSPSLNRIIGKSGEPLIRKGVDIAAGQHRRLCITHLHTHQCLYVGAILDVLIFSRKGGNQGCTAGKSQLGVRPQVHHIDVGVAPALNHRYGHIGELLHKQL